MNLLLSAAAYGKKKLKQMSVRNTRSTTRFNTNRASISMFSASFSMNATSYGVNVAVNNRHNPTNASQYIIFALRGFNNQRLSGAAFNPIDTLSSGSSASGWSRCLDHAGSAPGTARGLRGSAAPLPRATTRETPETYSPPAPKVRRLTFSFAEKMSVSEGSSREGERGPAARAWGRNSAAPPDDGLCCIC